LSANSAGKNLLGKQRNNLPPDSTSINQSINQLINQLIFNTMSSIRNSIQLIGYLGREPEIRTFNSGRKVGQVSIATSERFKDDSGEWQQRTQWHNLVAWGPQADYLEKYLHKGTFIGIRGKLTHRQYEGKDGKKAKRTEVVVNEFVPFSQKEKALAF
jgi:single-strand DNA-binding protein